MSKLIIDFDSYEDFDYKFKELMKEYKSLASFIAHNVHETDPGHEDEPTTDMYNKGLSLWKRFTRNNLESWCETQSNFLAYTLLNVKVTYQRFIAGFEYHCAHNHHYHSTKIERMMHASIDSFFGNNVDVYCVISAEPFINFREKVLDDSFLWIQGQETLWTYKDFMPIKKYQSYQLATAMGMHKRLGQSSIIMTLDNEILKMIWKNIGT